MSEPEPRSQPSDEGQHPAEAHDSFGGGLRTVAVRAVLGVGVGVLAGISSAAFLTVLNWATNTREAHGWLLFLLPVAGFAIGLAYHYGGKGSHAGNNLILDEIHEPRAWIPRRMAWLVYVGTIGTHLFGGSAGREGTAIQMSGSLTDWLNRVARVTGVERRVMLLAAISGGFSAVFGVPAAGMVFALEVQAVGHALRRAGLVPIVVAAVVGNEVVHLLGVEHTPYPTITGIDLTPLLIGKVALAGVAFGVAAIAFAELTHRTRSLLARVVVWPPARPIIGGLAVIALVYLLGNDRQYLGLSIPLITASLAGGVGVALGAFAWKTLFTAVTLGTGFQGGEVTPLFVVGATLGATLGHALGVPIPVMAACGFVAVFAGATNTPLACTVMGIELFGWGPTLLTALACAVSYLCSGPGGIYTTQRQHPLALRRFDARRLGFRPQPDIEA